MAPWPRDPQTPPAPLTLAPSSAAVTGSEPGALRRPSLRELQQAFAAGVFDDAPAVLAHVRDGVFPAARQFRIYRNNTFANLTDALAAVYPVVQRLVGADFFDGLADGFIRAHPPRSGNLHDFGAELADFLAAFGPARPLAYLPDVARLEWAWHRAFHAADATAFAFAALAQVPPEKYDTLVLQLHPSAQLLASDYPCRRIWETNQPGFEGDPTVDLGHGGERLLLVRPALTVELVPLDPGEYALLRAVAEAQALAPAHRAALAAAPDFDLTQTLVRHIQRGTISGFDFATTP